MRQECAALDEARQGREDGLINTIIQISSAALLAIPGLFFTSESKIPSLKNSPFLYVGISLFGMALVAAMLEQYLSAKAHARQITVLREYYFKKSAERYDEKFVWWVRATRNSACILFGAALLISALSLVLLNRPANGKSTTAASPAATSTSTSASAAPTATSVSPRRGLH